MIQIKYVLLLSLIYLATLSLPALFSKFSIAAISADHRSKIHSFAKGEIVISSLYEIGFGIAISQRIKWFNMQVSLANIILLSAIINTIVLIVAIIVLLQTRPKNKTESIDNK